MSAEPIVPIDRTFDSLYGLEVVEHTPDRVVGRVKVHDGVKQPMGLVHGGVFASMAESLTSAATYVAVAGENKIAMGMSNHTTFLRPITEGYVHAEAVPLMRGRTTWVWDVRITDDAARLCAVVRMTIAVRERR
jgi:1,4-dihydroxy-2-naphthoyl-CoA hydrolase